jgi:hypothetical protein
MAVKESLPTDDMSPSSDAGQQDSEMSAADNLNSLVQECGLPPHKISELLQELPPQRFSDALIDYYFNTMYVDFVSSVFHGLLGKIETGPVIPFLNMTFVQDILLYAQMVLESIQTMFVSSHCYLWFSLSP